MNLASFDGYRIQKTLRRPLTFSGVGIHLGKPCQMTLIPAGPNEGISFQRTDLKGAKAIPAHYSSVICTKLATSLGDPDHDENRINTVEHIMSAVFAMGISNLRIELNGPEIPILDGSAAPFFEEMWNAGLEVQYYSTPTLKVLKPIKIYENGTICELLPRERLRLTTSIDFPHPKIGLQTFALELTPEAFRNAICSARTFGFVRDLDKLKEMNLAQGASLENVLGFSEEEILNPEGPRFVDECVRHKLLDALGDLALCGSWIQGELVSYRGGHSIHFALLKQLKKVKSQWEFIPAEPLRSSGVPDFLRSAPALV